LAGVNATPRRLTRSLLAALAALAVPMAAAGQEPQPRSTLDLVVSYGYLSTFFDPGIGGYKVEGRSVKVLNVPLAFTLRDWKERGWGLRLRTTAVAGVEKVKNVGDVFSADFSALALIAGVEVPVPVGRSLFRPFFDVGLAYATDRQPDTPGSVGIGTLGLRTEHVFPWHRFELGLEPHVHYSLTWTEQKLRDDYAVAGIRGDARHPLFDVGGHTLTGIVYLQPAWFVEAQRLASGERDPTVDVRQQIEFGVGYGWRGDPLRIWILPIPQVSLGYSFGDTVSGFRLRIGGDRLLHLPPGTWADPASPPEAGRAGP
jgi:hypothetical protein